MAKKFTFRFSALQRKRDLIEKKRKREFGEAMQKMHLLTAEYKALGEKRYHSIDNLKEHQVGILDMNALDTARSWISTLSIDGAKKAQEIEQQQQVINERRTHLLQATKDCKVMEKLSERDRESWVKAIEREEQKNMDDLPHAASRHNEQGGVGQIFITIFAMASLSLFVVTGALFAFKILTPQKVDQIKWIMTDKGQFLNNDQVKIYVTSDENRKKYDKLFKKQSMATDGLAVNKSFEAQEKLLTKKRQALLEVEKRLTVLRAEVENEKNRIAAMQDQVAAKIKNFNDLRKKADDFAKSEGMAKAIKIFNNMDPQDISDTLTKGKDPSGDALMEAAEYIKKMREDMAAEVLAAMNIEWKQAIKDQLYLVPSR